MAARNGRVVVLVAFERITVEPDKMGGRPCIRGLRFTVAHLVRLVADGQTFEQIRDDFPFLEAADVREALEYAAAACEVTMLPSQDH